MTAILIDSSDLLDLMTEDPRWFSWSAAVVESPADSCWVSVFDTRRSPLSPLFSEAAVDRPQLTSLSRERYTVEIVPIIVVHGRHCEVSLDADHDRPR